MATYGIDILTGLPYLISSDEGGVVITEPVAEPSSATYGIDILTGERYITNEGGEIPVLVVAVDGVTITGNGTSGNPLVATQSTTIDGIGYVKASGKSISYDNSTYALDSHLHTGIYQPVGSYLTGTKVDSFNSRTGIISLLKADVEGVLTGTITSHTHSYQPLATVLTNTTASFTTAQETKLTGIATGATNVTNTNQLTNGAGYITGITSGNVTTALGYTPYNVTNPSSFISLTGISSSATGLTYTNTTGVFSLTSGYVIPTTTQSTNWTTAYTNNHTHSNTTALNAVTGTNTGDETKATIESKLTGAISTHTHNYGTGTVTSITATAPLTGGTISTTGSIGIQVANSVQSGYLSSTDWNTFNNKQPAGSYLTGTKVDSFNSRTGAVTLSKADIEAVLTGDISTHTHSTYSLTTHNHTGIYQPVGSYLTSFTETDPIYTASPAAGITSGNITSWNSAAASILPVDANGNLNIPATTTAVGMIMQNGSKLIHTFGTANLFIGTNAGNTTLTTGTQNTCIGTQAGRLFDTTSYNTAVGYQSLHYSATNTGENAAFGRMSLMFATGSYNSGLGNTSLGGASFSGSYCVGIGKDAGRTLTTGSHCTYIGYTAGYNGSQLATAQYSMALGDGAYNTKSYQVVLGASNITETVLRGVINIAPQTAPASATATGNTGNIIVDSSFIYVCTATNTWKRATLNTW